MSREKQIEELAKVIDEYTEPLSARDIHKADFSEQFAEALYNAGYRKQSEGCEFCGTTLYVKTVQHTMPLLAPITRADELRHELLNLTGEIYLPLEAKFCPICGAKMKGGAE